MQIIKNKDLTNLNTFRINQSCNQFYLIETKDEISMVDFSETTLILGGGSNILLSKKPDEVVHINTKGIDIISENEEEIILRAQAGENWDDFVKFCVDNEYYGAENLSFIPGTVGASPIQNIGAYGAEAKDIIEQVEYFDINKQQFEIIKNEKCNFDYRSSIFKEELKGNAVVMAVDFKLSKIKRLNLNYGGLKSYFSEEQETTINDVRTGVIEIRKAKLPDPFILGNSGSFFKNAIVEEQKLNELSAKYKDIPFYKVSDGYKIPTAWLIEKAGLKGYKMDKAAVYKGHSLILVNLGGATAQNILDLAAHIEEKIDRIFGIKISKEVNII